MNEEPKVNYVRELLKNEITWIIFIVSAVYGIVVTIILPIQKLQLQVTAVQENLSDNKTTLASIIEEHKRFGDRLLTVENNLRNK